MTQTFRAPAGARPRMGLFAALLLGAALIAAPQGVRAEAPFHTPAAFTGNIAVTSSERGSAIHAGGAVTISGRGLVPGQALVFQRGTTVLHDGAVVADAEGEFSFMLELPADAAVGLHPIVVLAENPSATTTVNLKVSPQIPLSGATTHEALAVQVAPGLYQSAYSPRSDALFVTGTVPRFPTTESSLVKLDPETLAERARAELPAAPARPGAEAGVPTGVIGVYGVGVDEANGTVWATNTLQNSVAVYAQDDLSLIKQFEPGLVYHARAVVIDPTRNRAFVSASASAEVHVFDSENLEHLQSITIRSGRRSGNFSVMDLALDVEGGRLFVTSRLSSEVAVIDTDTNTVARTIPVDGVHNTAGVAYDAAGGLLFVVGQDSDNLAIVNPESGEVLHLVPVGAGALGVAFEPVNRLAYVSSRVAGTVTVVTPEGEIIANLDNGSFPNHVHADGRGNVYAVNKALNAEDPLGDRVTKLHRRP